MNFQSHFERGYAQRLQINFTRLKKELKNPPPALRIKIQRYADKWGLTYEKVLNDLIRGDEYALRQIAVDPGRQNISEELQREFNPEISKPDKTYTWKSDKNKTKSIDGITTTGIFVFQKVIRENGGMQEDVKREAEDFIRVIQEDPSANNSKFIILIDDFTTTDTSRYDKFIKPENKNRIKVFNSNTFREF